MKKRKIVCTLMLAAASGLSAQTHDRPRNLPIVQTKFTADPAPVVYNDTVFLFTGHDEDDAEGFFMKDWQLYTSTDMVNWTDHGAVASLSAFSWVNGDNGAWAPQAIERNGTWYMYCPVWLGGIGVLTAKSPYGPWTDPIGKTLINNCSDDIDPTVWIDDDGQAYLYWGNPNLYYVKLNEDMVSFDTTIGDNGIVKCDVKPEDYQEGPWFYKRNGKYYMAYASTCCPEGIGYSMADSPLGPWKKTGTIMGHYGESSGNHPGIIDYKGHSYVFGFNYYLNSLLTDVHHERRSVTVAEMTYDENGEIAELPFWYDLPAVEPVGTVNPYKRTEAETMAWSEGLKTTKPAGSSVYVGSIDDGDYIKVRSVDFGTVGASAFKATVKTVNAAGRIAVCLDALDAKPVCVLEVVSSADWTELTAGIGVPVTGIHDVFFRFESSTDNKGNLFLFDHWRFNERSNIKVKGNKLKGKNKKSNNKYQ